MTWTYSQSTGDLSRDGSIAGKGYSGTGAGRNNPAMQGVGDVGPIPQGQYIIGPPHDTAHHGPFVLALTPAQGNHAFGRSGFLIHGDNVRHDASKGCIILSRPLRESIWASGDKIIEVVK
jgi:hypothetical protein